MTMTNIPDIDTDEFPLPSGCRFRMWTRAELEVGDARITFEGRHAGLMRELLRNRGRRVPSSLLWAAMLIDGQSSDGTAIEHVVLTEINHIRYALGVRGILLSIDDSEPDKGFMLSDVVQVDSPSRPTLVRARRRKPRQTSPQTMPQEPQVSRATNCDPSQVPSSFPDRVERHGSPESHK